MVTEEERYEIFDEYNYIFKPGDKVCFKYHDVLKHGTITSVGSLAQNKIKETKHGWWIFTKTDCTCKLIQPSYIIDVENDNKYVVLEKDISFDIEK